MIRHLAIAQPAFSSYSFHELTFVCFFALPTARISLRICQSKHTYILDSLIILSAAMFRRRPHTLPKDPSFPTDLEQLGYFINEKDQIRQIRNPEQKYQFAVNKIDRINDVYKEAMNGM